MDEESGESTEEEVTGTGKRESEIEKSVRTRGLSGRNRELMSETS